MVDGNVLSTQQFIRVVTENLMQWACDHEQHRRPVWQRAARVPRVKNWERIALYARPTDQPPQSTATGSLQINRNRDRRARARRRDIRGKE